jgi:hypothetical protein
MNKNVFSIICIIVIIILLYINFNNTESFQHHNHDGNNPITPIIHDNEHIRHDNHQHSSNSGDYKSIISFGRTYININKLKDITSWVNGTTNITGFNIEIPINNNGDVLGITTGGKIGIIKNIDKGTKWEVRQITNANFSGFNDMWNTDENLSKGPNEGNVINPGLTQPTNTMYYIFEPDDIWTERKIAHTTEKSISKIYRKSLFYDNLGGSGYIDAHDFNFEDKQQWEMSDKSVNPIKITNSEMTHLGPLEYLHSNDPNSIGINLNIDDAKLAKLLGGDGSGASADALQPQKCDTWLSKDAVSSICPGCIP